MVDGEVSDAGLAMTAESDEEQKRLRKQRLRSIAIALALGFLVMLFYAATIVRMGDQVLNVPH